MKSLGLVVFWIILASCLFAQKEVVVKKEVTTEKTVSVNVNKDDNGLRTVKITTTEGGDKKVIEWTDNGEIPSDIRKQLEEENIDIDMLDGSAGHHVTVTVGDDDNPDTNIWVDEDIVIEDDSRHKKMIVIKEDNDGEVTELRWDGDGDMPENMKELMKEHDISIEGLHEDHHEGHKTKMRIKKDKRKGMRRKAMRDGRSMNIKEQKSYKIVTKDEDGNEKVLEWSGDGAMPAEMKDAIGDEDIHILRMGEGKGKSKERRVVFFGDDDHKVSNAYMGAQIESVSDGARIIDVVKDSPADKAGLQKDDVVKRINGARAHSMEDLLGILTYFEPEDKVELIILRGGNEKKLNLILGERPDAYK